ncbi:hypothetical protein MBLNU459_g1677t1 [Dothideomycetes sp. NU459]
MALMGQPFKRRKLSSSQDSQWTASSSSYARQQYSHGLEDVQPSHVLDQRVDEIHVHIRNHSPIRNPALYGEDGHHRHHRRQTGTGMIAASSTSSSSPSSSSPSSPTVVVSVVASVDVSGNTVAVSTLSAAFSAATDSASAADSATTTDAGSATSSSASPQDTATTPTTPLTSATTVVSSDGASTVASATGAQTTSMATLSSTDSTSSGTATPTLANTSRGMIGFSATTPSVSSVASTGASVSVSPFPTGSNGTIAATGSASSSGIALLTSSSSDLQTISASASDSRNLTTSATVITSDSSTYTSFTTFDRVSTATGSAVPSETASGVGRTYTDYTTFMTSFANGAIATLTEERQAVVTLLSDGNLMTSYGSYVAYSTDSALSSAASSASALTSASMLLGSSSFSSSPTSDAGASTGSTKSLSQTAVPSSTASGVIAGGSRTSAATTAASTGTSTSTSTTGDSNDNNTPPASVLAGGIVGGVAGLAVLLLIAMVILRWYRKRGAFMHQLTGTEAAANPAGGAGPRSTGMAERAGLAPVLTPLLGVVGLGRNNRSRAPSDTGERGFQRVSGRKLPSAFSEGMTSHPPPMPAFNSDRNLSNASFYRDSTGFYGGEGESGSGPFADPADHGANETIMPGPARQATVHRGGPYELSPTSATTALSPVTPTFPERQHMLTPTDGRQTPSSPLSPPGTANRSVTPATLSSFEGSRGSRFTEEV